MVCFSLFPVFKADMTEWLQGKSEYITLNFHIILTLEKEPKEAESGLSATAKSFIQINNAQMS